MALSLSNKFRSSACDYIRSTVEYLHVYSGVMPSDPNDGGTSGTLLVSIELPQYAWTAASNGTAGFVTGVTYSGVAVADGTAGWARLTDDPATKWLMCDNIGTALTCAIALDDINVSSGGTVTISDMDLIHSAT